MGSKVPRLWPGGSCFIIGGGPSLQVDRMEELRGRRVIVTNNAFLLMPWADVLFYMDYEWAQKYRTELRAFKGLIYTIAQAASINIGGQHINRGPQGGLSIDNDRLHTGMNAGHCALNLAVHFGVKEIILLGFDMHRQGGRDNWHNDHERTVGDEVYRDTYLHHIEGTAPILKRLGISVKNATPGSAITVFPTVNLDDCL